MKKWHNVRYVKLSEMTEEHIRQTIKTFSPGGETFKAGRFTVQHCEWVVKDFTAELERRGLK